MTNNEMLAITLVAKGIETACGAVEAGTEITFRLSAPRRIAVCRINAVLFPDEVKEDGAYADTVRRLYPDDSEDVADPMDMPFDKGARRPITARLDFKWAGLEKGRDIYEAEWQAEWCYLYHLRAELVTPNGNSFTEKQITVYRKGFSVPDWMIDGVMYQILWMLVHLG